VRVKEENDSTGEVAHGAKGKRGRRRYFDDTDRPRAKDLGQHGAAPTENAIDRESCRYLSTSAENGIAPRVGKKRSARRGTDRRREKTPMTTKEKKGGKVQGEGNDSQSQKPSSPFLVKESPK